MVAMRLKEGEDLKQSICNFVKKNGYTSASVVCAVGSLGKARIRMAGAKPDTQDIREYNGIFEIVSLIGTIDQTGKSHLHISIADPEGKVIGGHLKEGSIVHTTVELTMINDPNLVFTRKVDDITGFDELYIEEKKVDGS